MTRRIYIFSNVCILLVLVALTAVIFAVDLNRIFLTVSAPLYNGNRERPEVSIMISITQNSPLVEPMMEILTERGVDATFFVTGSWVKQNMELAQRMGERFELGNSGFSGESLQRKTQAAIHEQIDTSHQVIKSVTGACTALFSPPGGGFGRNTLRAAEGLGYTTIMWSRDTRNDISPDMIFTRATRYVKNGDLILFAPSLDALAALPQAIDYFLTNGFSVVRVSESIS